MAYRSLKSLFTSSNFNLPYLLNDNDKSFRHYFEIRMAEYLTEIKKIPANTFNANDKDDLIVDINEIVEDLDNVFETYLKGFPSAAYLQFCNLIKKNNLSPFLIDYRTIKLNAGHRFYRTKKEYTKNNPINGKISYCGVNKLYNCLDMFHVPFQKRKTIGTNRFSIPGYPCLYLSDSLYTSWAECMADEKKDFSPFHAISFSNNRPLHIVDFAPLNFINRKKTKLIVNGYVVQDNVSIIQYARLYPIIIACHSKIKYKTNYNGEIKFKSEYIIPQMLLQWFRENNFIIDGIRHLSCASSLKFPNKNILKYNYVLPVSNCTEFGYCSSLQHVFSSSRVYTFIKNKTKKPIDNIISSATSSLRNQTFYPLV